MHNRAAQPSAPSITIMEPVHMFLLYNICSFLYFVIFVTNTPVLEGNLPQIFCVCSGWRSLLRSGECLLQVKLWNVNYTSINQYGG